ncbi:Na-translocating system protein MpsC family protein [Clostridium ganghwense]|uniref:Stage 0 sporulation protein A homolog n=1 Tax=Clostridium ganghwense TaxID=312089 RepID=A0ABT4CKK4_9CLOT|nr:Na-translocating system protein MpsC family protein [Clostridium ganghwense]MCY6369578.1 Na-translocating system protein MpsC family protein [Clostridium ganghwense]
MKEFEKSILQSMTILYVEDEPVTRKVTTEAIKKIVGKLYTADNGKDGIRKFEMYQPDIVITDLVMEDMTGIEMSEEIRKKENDCSIIVTSALDDAKSILKTVDVGIEKYIIKPIDIEELVEVLLRIGKKRLRLQTENYIATGGNLLTKEQKRYLEKMMRNLCGIYLKDITGKGARTIQVLVKGNQIEIKAIGCLTVMEENLIDNGYDYKMIDFNRNFLYKATQKDIEKKFSTLCNTRVYLQKIESNSEEGYDKFIFSFQKG